MTSKQRVAVLTGGGDCPGLNAVIRAVVRSSINDHGWDVLGIFDGYEGLIEGRMRPLAHDDVSSILIQGGTMLGTSNKANPFAYTINGGKGEDVSGRCIENLRRWGVDILIAIGGDGSLTIANKLKDIWPNVVGVPKTIDNDLRSTDQTFGFDTACGFVTYALDRIHSTAQSHHRAMVIEVMGRYAGWIALEGGVAGGGDIILIPELEFEFDKVADAIENRRRRGKKSSIIVVAEGAHPKNQGVIVKQRIEDSPDPIRLGGVGQLVANEIENRCGIESRVTVLGHLQRGGSPTFFDRVLATRYGSAAVEFAAKGDFGKMVALKGLDIVAVPLAEAVDSLNLVDKNHHLVKTAISLGTSFGI